VSSTTYTIDSTPNEYAIETRETSMKVTAIIKVVHPILFDAYIPNFHTGLPNSIDSEVSHSLLIALETKVARHFTS